MLKSNFPELNHTTGTCFNQFSSSFTAVFDSFVPSPSYSRINIIQQFVTLICYFNHITVHFSNHNSRYPSEIKHLGSKYLGTTEYTETEAGTKGQIMKILLMYTVSALVKQYYYISDSKNILQS